MDWAKPVYGVPCWHGHSTEMTTVLQHEDHHNDYTPIFNFSDGRKGRSDVTQQETTLASNQLVV
jgi:hypothetical protein